MIRRMDVWIDTHCHLDEFADHGGAALADAERARAAQAGVAHCVLPAVELANLQAVRDLAHRHGDSYALGIHPLFTPVAGDEDLPALARALEQYQDDPRLVAVGEIGLDLFVPHLDTGRQQHFYRAQLQLARRFDLPVILHVRRSTVRCSCAAWPPNCRWTRWWWRPMRPTFRRTGST